MQGMPISSVAPRGCFAGGATSRIVSAELLRFRDSRSVDALLEETTLACFSWETGVGFGFALIVPTALSSLFSWERDCPFTFGNGVDDLFPQIKVIRAPMDSFEPIATNPSLFTPSLTTTPTTANFSLDYTVTSSITFPCARCIR